MKAELLKNISAIETEIAEMKKLIEASEELKAEEVDFDFEEFKDGKIAVHCDTEEKANIFLAYLHGKGIKWCAGEATISYNNWGFFKEETCYSYERDGICRRAKSIYRTIIPFTLKMLEGN